MRKAIGALLFCLLITNHYPLITPAKAQTNPDRDKPLEILADQTLEWHRNDAQFIARGNVVVTQGDVRITADTLTADYRESAASSFEIYRLTAAGNVRIVSQGNTATGERAVYEIDRGVAVMTGNNLSLTSPDQKVTAQDSFEYWVTEGRLTAKGGTQVTRGQDRLDASTVSAIFTESAAGQRQLKKLTADGDVRITTPTEVLTGRQGVYDAATNIAEIVGDVKITRGPNVLEGERAEVNLTTNVSTMQGGSEGGGRVRGVFYPDSDDPENTPLAPQSATEPSPQNSPQTPVRPQFLTR